MKKPNPQTQLEQVVKAPEIVTRFWIALFAFGIVGGGIVTQVTINQANIQRDLATLKSTVEALVIGQATTLTQTQTYQNYARERQAATDIAIQAILNRINQLHNQ